MYRLNEAHEFNEYGNGRKVVTVYLHTQDFAAVL